MPFFSKAVFWCGALVWIFGGSSLPSASTLVAQTYTTVVNNGASSNRVDMIFVGDGYTSTQIETDYATHVNQTIDYFFNGDQAPFPRYQSFFNAHRVNVISNESGADRPLDNYYVDTALDASYSWGGGAERCLYLDTFKANQAVSAALSGSGIDIDMRLGTVNDSKYGGCGGQWAVYAGANSSSREIALHEIGHSYGGLADEYFYNDDTYTGGEPSAPNVTRSPMTGKWDRWLGYDDPDTDIGPIDYYEGGRYYRYGIYRPSDNSKMRALNRPFDAISREQFIKTIYEEVDPLDDWLDTSTVYDYDALLWVDTVDPNVIGVEWSIDGNSLGLLGETLDVSSLALAPGAYQVTARAYDLILDHSFTGDSLDWWRLPDTSSLQQTTTWSLLITVPEPSSGASLVAGVLLCAMRRRGRDARCRFAAA